MPACTTPRKVLISRAVSARRSRPGLACPQVTSMAPNHGTAGIHVTLHGVGLERATIQFGNKRRPCCHGVRRQPIVVVPKGSGTVSVSGEDRLGAERPSGVVLVPRQRHRRIPYGRSRRTDLRLRRRTGVRCAESCVAARHRSSAWPSTKRPAAIGSPRLTATCTASTHRSTGVRDPIR